MVCDKVDSAYEAKLCVGYLSLAFSYCGRCDDLFWKKCRRVFQGVQDKSWHDCTYRGAFGMEHNQFFRREYISLYEFLARF